jgi:hypothetical protein
MDKATVSQPGRHLMAIALAATGLCLCVMFAGRARGEVQDFSQWTVYVTNDNCPDYTWGYTEGQTRKSFADIVRGHLDEMRRTDNEDSANRDRYNMAVTQEALCFVEHYPEREEELVRRIKEGRVYVSPYLCNSLWGLQSVEGAIRTFYPARRLEKKWGISIDVAEHIELPSLPWGVAPILAGCGIRWLSNPYYGYDSTFGGLKNPPLFILEGPDTSKVRVVMDRWACGKSSYMQGARILGNPQPLTDEWMPHYVGLGKAYPLKAVLASGTHGDINPGSGGQARRFSEAIMEYNSRPGTHPRLVNATLSQFCEAVDKAEAERPFLQTIRGSFGHSWDLWPVCLAKYAADMREGQRRFLSAEALLAVAARNNRGIQESTAEERQRAEWCWAMLSDHAWNGTSEQNKRHNAELRRRWSEELNRHAASLLGRGWAAAGLKRNSKSVSVFNSLSVPRRGLVCIERPQDIRGLAANRETLACQPVAAEGRDFLCFVSPEIEGFGLIQLRLKAENENKQSVLQAGPTTLESPYYRLRVDAGTGGISSLVHMATGVELVAAGRQTLCQTTYFNGEEHAMKDVKTEVVACGPVLARLKVSGTIDGIEVRNFVTVYAKLDRVDFDVRIHKPVTTEQQRLCQVFPVLQPGSVLRVETTGAVIRPRPQPEGDLLAGADTRRFAVQGFVDASVPNGVGVTIAPLDSFCLRLDLGGICFEAIGNDQNYREVLKDQNGVKDFRFRYALRAHGGGFSNAEALAWSTSAARPLTAELGSAPIGLGTRPVIKLDPSRAIATCLKPADGGTPGSSILRIRETAGRSEPLKVRLTGYDRAIQTDLLERDEVELKIAGGEVTMHPNAYGFCALRLLP